MFIKNNPNNRVLFFFGTGKGQNVYVSDTLKYKVPRSNKLLLTIFKRHHKDY